MKKECIKQRNAMNKDEQQTKKSNKQRRATNKEKQQTKKSNKQRKATNREMQQTKKCNKQTKSFKIKQQIKNGVYFKRPQRISPDIRSQLE